MLFTCDFVGTLCSWEDIGLCRGNTAKCHFQLANKGGKSCALLKLDDPTTDNLRRIHVQKAMPYNARELIFEASYYLDPSAFYTNTWVNIHRAIEERYPYPNSAQGTWYQIVQNIFRSAGAFRIEVPINNGGGQFLDPPLPPRTFLYNKSALPENEWFKIRTYVKRDLTNGVFKLWVKDVLEIEHYGRTMGVTDEKILEAEQGLLCPDGQTRYGGLKSGLSNYTAVQPAGSAPISVYATDVLISTDAEIPPPTPTPPEEITVLFPRVREIMVTNFERLAQVYSQIDEVRLKRAKGERLL